VCTYSKLNCILIHQWSPAILVSVFLLFVRAWNLRGWINAPINYTCQCSCKYILWQILHTKSQNPSIIQINLPAQHVMVNVTYLLSTLPPCPVSEHFLCQFFLKKDKCFYCILKICRLATLLTGWKAYIQWTLTYFHSCQEKGTTNV
jgi:hypothetical protein